LHESSSITNTCFLTHKQVDDPATAKYKTSFFLGETQIGLTGEYGINEGLLKNKNKYRGMAVPGGKVDFFLRPLDFGPEEEEEEDMSFLDML
jgi:hypothetical protein